MTLDISSFPRLSRTTSTKATGVIPLNFMRRSRVRSAMSVIADAIATPEEGTQEMYGVEFTDEELDQARTIQTKNCAQA